MMNYVLRVDRKYWADDWKKPDFAGFWTSAINKAKKFETLDEIEAIVDRWCFFKHAGDTKDGQPIYANTVIGGVICYALNENNTPIPLRDVVFKNRWDYADHKKVKFLHYFKAEDIVPGDIVSIASKNRLCTEVERIDDVFGEDIIRIHYVMVDDYLEKHIMFKDFHPLKFVTVV